MLVEVQALVADSYSAEQGAPPTRRAAGLDGNRLSLLLAVLQKRCGGLGLSRCDVYANVAGGIRLQEPALDLPLVLAISSSRTNTTLDSETAACGEIGLGGEIRAVSGLDARLRELAKLGFRRCLVPARALPDGLAEELQGLQVVPVGTLAEALRAMGLPTTVDRPAGNGKPRKSRERAPEAGQPDPWPPPGDGF